VGRFAPVPGLLSGAPPRPGARPAGVQDRCGRGVRPSANRTRVREIMTPVVFTVTPDTPAQAVVETMLERAPTASSWWTPPGSRSVSSALSMCCGICAEGRRGGRSTRAVCEPPGRRPWWSPNLRRSVPRPEESRDSNFHSGRIRQSLWSEPEVAMKPHSLSDVEVLLQAPAILLGATVSVIVRPVGAALLPALVVGGAVLLMLVAAVVMIVQFAWRDLFPHGVSRRGLNGPRALGGVHRGVLDEGIPATGIEETTLVSGDAPPASPGCAVAIGWRDSMTSRPPPQVPVPGRSHRLRRRPSWPGAAGRAGHGYPRLAARRWPTASTNQQGE
jgi:hypothetical protein